MAKEGFSDLLGATGVINWQSWPNNLELETRWKISIGNCCFAPILLDHTYYCPGCQVWVSGRVQPGTLLGRVGVVPGKQHQLLGRQVGGVGQHLPGSKTTSRPFEGRLLASPRGTSRGFGDRWGEDHRGGGWHQDIPDCHRPHRGQLSRRRVIGNTIVGSRCSFHNITTAFFVVDFYNWILQGIIDWWHWVWGNFLGPK